MVRNYPTQTKLLRLVCQQAAYQRMLYNTSSWTYTQNRTKKNSLSINKTEKKSSFDIVKKAIVNDQTKTSDHKVNIL